MMQLHAPQDGVAGVMVPGVVVGLLSVYALPLPGNAPCRHGRGVPVFQLKEAIPMFEGQPQTEIDELIKSDPEFKQLYQRHKTLDKKCMDAELGVLPIDDVTLAQMKREKLVAKQKLLRLYEQKPH